MEGLEQQLDEHKKTTHDTALYHSKEMHGCAALQRVLEDKLEKLQAEMCSREQALLKDHQAAEEEAKRAAGKSGQRMGNLVQEAQRTAMQLQQKVQLETAERLSVDKWTKFGTIFCGGIPDGEDLEADWFMYADDREEEDEDMEDDPRF